MSLKRVCYSGSIHFPLSVLRRENISKCHLHVWSTGCISGIVTFQNSFTIFLKERTDERTLRCFSCRLFVHSPRLSAVRTYPTSSLCIFLLSHGSASTREGRAAKAEKRRVVLTRSINQHTMLRHGSNIVG